MTIPLPSFGLGCAPFGNLFRERSDEEVDTALDAAWEAGVRHFDTAPHYGLGLSEERLGGFLRTKPRDEFVISTKVGRLLETDPDWDGHSPDAAGFVVPGRMRRVWDTSEDGIRRSLEGSLERLGLDRVDVLYLHDPQGSPEPHAVETGIAALAAMRDEGLVRGIGTGTADIPSLLTAVRTGLADVIMVANRYTLLDHSARPEVVEACAQNNTRIVAAAVFNSGLLARRPTPSATYDYAEVPADILRRALEIDAVCASFGVELPTAALQYPLLDPVVESVVVGAGTASQVRENLARLDAPVPGELWAELDARGLVPVVH